MRPAFIRAAAVVALVQGLAHGCLVLLAKPSHGPDEKMVVSAMKTHVFSFSGAVRSYWDLYFGYALLAAGTCLVEAVLLWLLARFTDGEPQILRRMIWLIILANLAHALMVLRFFFLAPLAPDGIVVLLLLLSLVGGGRKPA